MSFPVISPQFFTELTDKENPQNVDNITYNVLTTPASIEYVFPLCQERVLEKLMETKGVMQYRMANLPDDVSKEYEEKGAKLIKDDPILRYYWNLKYLTMNVLQNRNYTMDDRMLILNYCYKTVQTMIDKIASGQEKDVHIVEKFVSSVMQSPRHDGILKMFEGVKEKLNPVYPFYDGLSIITVIPVPEGQDEAHKKFVTTCLKKAGQPADAKGFMYDEELHPAMKQYFKDNYEYVPGKAAEEGQADRTHYLEQVMVNYVWTYCMPFADFKLDLWKNYTFFNILYNTVKTAMTCYLYKSRTPDTDFIFAMMNLDAGLRTVKGSVVRKILSANEKQGTCNNGDMAILTLS